LRPPAAQGAPWPGWVSVSCPTLCPRSSSSSLSPLLTVPYGAEEGKRPPPCVTHNERQPTCLLRSGTSPDGLSLYAGWPFSLRRASQNVRRKSGVGGSTVPTLGQQGTRPVWEVGTSESRARSPLGYYFLCCFRRAPSPPRTGALGLADGFGGRARSPTSQDKLSTRCGE
jgi:hypothetical protein